MRGVAQQLAHHERGRLRNTKAKLLASLHGVCVHPKMMPAKQMKVGYIIYIYTYIYIGMKDYNESIWGLE